MVQRLETLDEEEEEEAPREREEEETEEFALEFDDGGAEMAGWATTPAILVEATKRLERGFRKGGREYSDDEASFTSSGSSNDEVRAMGGMVEEAAGRARRAEKAASARTEHEARDEAAIETGAFEAVVRWDEGSFPRKGRVGKSWEELSLSRPLLRGVAAAGYAAPTPIQEAVIPLAASGRDVCASAATGSGKTAAFALPCLERFLGWRSSNGGRTLAAIKMVVILPTRELAAQCRDVFRDMGKYVTGFEVVLVVGGSKTVRQQEAALKRRPDCVVATPGRLLDHATNSSLSLDEVSACVLDEADRLLDLGFEDEVKRLLAELPGGGGVEKHILGTGSGRRQTLLFSATFGASVETLAALSLRRPVRVKVTAGAQAGGVAARLTQDFVKLHADASKDGRDAEDREREAAFLVAVSKSLPPPHQILAFFETRAQVARMARVIRALKQKISQTTEAQHHTAEEEEEQQGGDDGLLRTVPEALELHGGLKQHDRSANLQAFADGDCRLLLCTDVASRGLDLDTVRYVVNFDMPRTAAAYVHRVGRTARAGRSGLSVTLVGSGRRAVLKDFLRARQAELDAEQASNLDDGRGGAVVETLREKKNTQDDQVRHRTLPRAAVESFKVALAEAEPIVADLEEEDKLAAAASAADRETERAYNLVAHAAEIAARPKREWFQSTKDRKDLKDRLKAGADDEARAADGFVSEKARKKIRDTAKKALGVAVRGARARDDDLDGHRLSRKKRRRMLALAEVAARPDDDDDDDREELESPATKPKRVKVDRRAIESDRELGLAKIKRQAKRAKAAARDKLDADDDKVLADRGPGVRTTFGLGNADPGDRLAARSPASGGGGSTRNFTDFDPSRVSKKKKHAPGHAAFKSKARYKRRT